MRESSWVRNAKMTNGKWKMENGKSFFLHLPPAPAACTCRLHLPPAPAAYLPV